MTSLILSGVLSKDQLLSPVDALILAALGIVLVFAVLIVLMLIIWLMGYIVDNSTKVQQKHPEWQDKIANAKKKLKFWSKPKTADENCAVQDIVENSTKNEASDGKNYAKGSCGELTLINTDEREAAMIMAIVADQMQTPLNELRFKSIKKI